MESQTAAFNNLFSHLKLNSLNSVLVKIEERIEIFCKDQVSHLTSNQLSPHFTLWSQNTPRTSRKWRHMQKKPGRASPRCQHLVMSSFRLQPVINCKGLLNIIIKTYIYMVQNQGNCDPKQDIFCNCSGVQMFWTHSLFLVFSKCHHHLSPPDISLSVSKTSRSNFFTPAWTGLQTYHQFSFSSRSRFRHVTK